MNSPELDFSQAIDADAQLQEELRGMFAVETQSYLERYLQIAEHLQTLTWRSDIQELYRCVHTIKGGAVTVGAEAALRVATALEDVLSDLRYLEAPQLTDSHLSQLLLECGELLTVALEIQTADETAPLIRRIHSQHQEIRSRYLPQGNDLKPLQQEFVEQGFDLIVLELDIALEQLPPQGQVPEATRQTAQAVLHQLQQIGRELQLSSAWTSLLERAQDLFAHPINAVWRSQWSRLFEALKTCAQQGEGLAFAFELDQTEERAEPVGADVGAWLDGLSTAEFEAVPELGDWLDSLTLNHRTAAEDAIESPIDLPLEAEPELELDELEADGALQLSPPESAAAVAQPAVIQQLLNLMEPAAPPERQPVTERVQIPVALEKLDQSSQALIETLLALQTAQGFYQTLQNQISQLVTLAQEGAQSITHLRQIQDDYALLDQIKDPMQAGLGPAPERYRQGYAVINRLLETSLRLSEVGAETGKTVQQVTGSFQQIHRNATRLQSTIEDSRLVPFQNLVFRAKTILRDLTTRYGKPAQLVVQGEQLELDVSITRVLEPALLHLIRNAYDHALESPEERIVRGKPQQGTITLTLQRQGNLFQFEIRDDGRGIDPAVVQAKAQALGLPLTCTDTAADLLAVICQPGFSSQSAVNEISGRGIGMDVVATQVARLNGRLELQTALGTGTTFQLKFPVPRLLVPCVLLKTGDRVFAVPNDDVKTIALFSSLQPQGADAAGWVVEDEAGSTPIVDTLKCWQPQLAQRAIGDTAVCLYIASGAMQQGVWLLADELLEQSELIINPLPAPLMAPQDLIGVNLQPDGCLIPVFEAAPLVDRLSAAPAPLAAGASTESASAGSTTTDGTGQLILIVDDAALMRRRLEASLAAYGYSTYACVDGQDAWNWLQSHPHPRLIITDIEMPNMDGFTLVDRCRSVGMTMPILMVTSRLLEEWSNEAYRLGATDYLTKGFSTIDLVKKVDALLSLPVST